ncbi:hypothetical protein KCK34_001618 [Clostridium perfringens]|uniref:hypothetical protein n=1 Tax=Clostridium perfringens TaxID=1502 RepID=UPI001D78F910|nr:hypothetical protein [Clostridium perfringens]EHK2335177.1 hypothetical protein [Clostridium perfringens]
MEGIRKMFSNIDVTLQLGTVITLFATLVSAFVSALVSMKIARNKRVIEIITSNRVEWIKETRQLFSQYITYTKFYTLKGVPKDTKKWFEELMELTNKIKLQLNPAGDKDKKILKEIEKLNKAYEKLFILGSGKSSIKSREQVDSYLLDDEKIQSYMDNICKIKNEKGYKESKEYYDIAIIITQSDLKLELQNIKYLSKLIEIFYKIYLKCEWERVKVEAKKGIKCNYDFDKEFEKIENSMSDDIKTINDNIKKGKEKMIDSVVVSLEKLGIKKDILMP